GQDRMVEANKAVGAQGLDDGGTLRIVPHGDAQVLLLAGMTRKSRSPCTAPSSWTTSRNWLPRTSAIATGRGVTLPEPDLTGCGGSGSSYAQDSFLYKGRAINMGKLFTPQNSALLLIDHQVGTMQLIKNIDDEQAKRMSLAVNFQEVVHSVWTWTLMSPNLSDSRRT